MFDKTRIIFYPSHTTEFVFLSIPLQVPHESNMEPSEEVRKRSADSVTFDWLVMALVATINPHKIFGL